MIILGAFLTNLLCGLTDKCFPTYEPPKANDISIGFRSALDIPRETYPIVSLPNYGSVQGYTMKTIGGREIHAFEGIPYAEPPIADLRFRSPTRKQPWEGTIYAASTTKQCIQTDLSKAYAITGNEDCLYLNVYSPDVPKEEKANYPVFIWFYGGAFMFGSKDQYGPSYFLDKDVIVVSVNYRLGVFGFLSTGDEAASGNFGLKDQRLAMQWVQENIGHFGGDKSRVTLIGQSAGAASSHLHMLSKSSTGLFRNVISLSASAFCSWALPRGNLKNSYKLAKFLNCNNTQNTEQLVNCLRSRSDLAVASAQLKLYEWLNWPAVNFGPTIESENVPDAFLTKTPEEIYKAGEVNKVPWVTGFVPNEGNVYNILMMLAPWSFFTVNRNFNNLAPMTLDYRDTSLSNLEKTRLSKKIRQQYFGNKVISHNTLKEHGDMYGDRYLLTGIYKGMKYHSKVAPTYGYLFNYYGDFSILQRTGMDRKESGVAHYDDIQYIFNSSQFHRSINFDDPDYIMTEFLIDLWVNFATYNEPLHTNEIGDETKFWDPIAKLEKQNSSSTQKEKAVKDLELDSSLIYKMLNGTFSRELSSSNNKENDTKINFDDKDFKTFKILEINKYPKLIDFPKEYLDRIEFWENLKIP